jgi:addiction module RelE/StbE family toxin
MKKKHKIHYLPIAQQDLVEIFDYIMSDNPKAAANFIDKIDKSISKLETFPKLGVVPKDDRLEFMGYRMLVINNYLVFYVIRDSIVEIRRIIHGSRKYSFLL